MGTQPADIANRAFDMIGRSDLTIGDIEEGSEGSLVALRVYDKSLRQLLRAAHWSFARKMAPLTLLADASGQTSGVGTSVVPPWIYEYAVPPDMMQARFVPWNAMSPVAPVPGNNISVSSVPQTSVGQPPWPPGTRLIPAPFLVSVDTNYPVDLASNWQDTYGTSPAGRVVVLTNVLWAQLVYTAYMPYPSMWQADFEQALVNYITSQIAMSLAKDQRLGRLVRDDTIKATKEAVQLARVASANEGSYRQSTDQIPDWINVRATGAGAFGIGSDWGGGAGYAGPGGLYGGWCGLAMADGSVF